MSVVDAVCSSGCALLGDAVISHKNCIGGENDKMAEKRVCFVIAPIGEKDSATRHRSERVYEDIIKPAARKRRYLPVHAMDVTRPGLIMPEVIRRVVDAPLVIADLTDGNPYVFYELSLRHAVRRPVIQLVAKDQQILSNVKGIKMISFDIDDVKSRNKAIVDIIKQIEEIEGNPTSLETPISIAGIDLRTLWPENEGTQTSLTAADDLLIKLESLTPAEAIPALLEYIEDLKKHPNVFLLDTPIDDLDAACMLVNNVPEEGHISATSSLQEEDADERESYRSAVNLALKRRVTYRKVICSSSGSALSAERYEKWLAEFTDKADLIKKREIKPEAFQLLHYPSPMSVDVLIAQDPSGECQEMVAGFAGGGGHGGFHTKDKRMAWEWLDVYLEKKIMTEAKRHTKAVLEGVEECFCLEFLELLDDARQMIS